MTLLVHFVFSVLTRLNLALLADRLTNPYTVSHLYRRRSEETLIVYGLIRSLSIILIISIIYVKIFLGL